MNHKLLSSYDECLRYKQANKLVKPMLNPCRFIKNRIRQISRPTLGTVGKVNAFHMKGFVVVAGEAISEGIACHGVIEKDLTAAFLRLVEPGHTTLDIGMHLGYFSTLFARLVGETGQVHSFEPTPSTREIARRNTSRFPVITVYPNAMWSHRESMVFHDYGVTHMAFNSVTAARSEENLVAASEYEVEAISLDEFRSGLNRKIDVIKVDAESAELQILKGAKETLAKDRPIVTLEVGDSADDPGWSRRLIETMQEMGYRAWEFHDGKFVIHSIRPTYRYDNLIFAPESRNLG